jgi:Ca2+/Na+ antiporter
MLPIHSLFVFASEFSATDTIPQRFYHLFRRVIENLSRYNRINQACSSYLLGVTILVITIEVVIIYVLLDMKPLVLLGLCRLILFVCISKIYLFHYLSIHEPFSKKSNYGYSKEKQDCLHTTNISHHIHNGVYISLVIVILIVKSELSSD